MAGQSQVVFCGVWLGCRASSLAQGKAPGGSTRASPATPSRVRRAEAREGPSKEKAQGTPLPGYRKPGFSQTWTKSSFRTPVRGAELSGDARGGTGRPVRSRTRSLIHSGLLGLGRWQGRPRRGPETRMEREASDAGWTGSYRVGRWRQCARNRTAGQDILL